jgi:hypothetical protein
MNFIKNTIDGMSLAISEEFGKDYKIYTEFTEQGLKGPCFFIGCISGNEADGLNERFRARYMRKHDMQVIMFPEKGSIENAALYNDAAERLYNTLENINMGGDIVRGSDRHHEISDGVMVFYVTYEFPLVRIDDDRAKMEELEMM